MVKMKSKNHDRAGQRYSRQREEILNIVRATKTHPTADWVYEQTRQILPSISLGTVYRNLNLLAEEGIIQRLVFEDGKVHFDGNVHEHHHFLCEDNGKILDVEKQYSSQLIEQLFKDTGLKARGCKIEFYGVSESEET